MYLATSQGWGGEWRVSCILTQRGFSTTDSDTMYSNGNLYIAEP